MELSNNEIHKGWLTLEEDHNNQSDSELFAGYRVTSRGGTNLSVTNKHQIQHVAMLLNAYETFK